MNSLFENLIADQDTVRYSPVMHTKLSTNNERDSSWIVQLDDFISKKECEYFIELWNQLKLNQPETNIVWCNDSCYSDKIYNDVIERISKIFKYKSIPTTNFENALLEKYTANYDSPKHVDFSEEHTEKQYGPRILTFFIFLNNVTKGGGKLYKNKKIVPQSGRALLWSNVLNHDLTQSSNMLHQTIGVTEGEMFSIRIFIHLRDFMTPYKNQCV